MNFPSQAVLHTQDDQTIEQNRDIFMTHSSAVRSISRRNAVAFHAGRIWQLRKRLHLSGASSPGLIETVKAGGPRNRARFEGTARIHLNREERTSSRVWRI